MSSRTDIFLRRRSLIFASVTVVEQKHKKKQTKTGPESILRLRILYLVSMEYPQSIEYGYVYSVEYVIPAETSK